jgi:hypothetical protein
MSPLQDVDIDVETQCIASLLSGGYAHFIPAGLGKKTIKIKITPVYYEF